MRRLLVLLGLLWGVPVLAQSTTVSGTITDAGAQAWFAGTIQFLFRPADSNPTAQYFWNGAPFDKSTTIPANPLSLNGSGAFSGISVPSNTAIAPAGSTWTVTACPAATVPNCFTKNLTITGTTQDISSQVIPPAVVVNLSVPLLGARAYADGEIVGGTPGIQYFNVTDNTVHVCVQSGFPPCTWLAQSTGGSSLPVFNGALYVGGNNATFWGGGDIGAQINAAYASLPAPGGTIYVIPQASGLCYDFTTQVVATTANRYLRLDSTGADSQNGTVSNGACMNYTPTTSGAAVTLDYVPSGGGGNGRNHGISHLRIINNQCNTTGGCGSSATGVSCTSVHGGCQNATFENFMVTGFGTGFNIATPITSSQASWGLTFAHGAINYNTTGLTIANGIESILFDDVKLSSNGQGTSMGTSSGLIMLGGSVDSNTTGNVSTGSDFTAIGTWWENQGASCSANVAYVNAGLTATIVGGIAHDDCASGSGASYWFNSPSIAISGQTIVTAGRIPTVVYQYSTSAHVTGIANINLIPRGNVVATVGGNAVFSERDNTLTSIESSLFEADSGTAFSCTFVSLSAGWGTTRACSNPLGGNQRFSFTITASGTGQSASPTITVTLSSPWHVSPLYQCKMVGGTGTPAFVTGETTVSSTTVLGPLIFNATPGAGLTYQISCMGI
jgi:hypothetical protein